MSRGGWESKVWTGGDPQRGPLYRRGAAREKQQVTRKPGVMTSMGPASLRPWRTTVLSPGWTLKSHGKFNSPEADQHAHLFCSDPGPLRCFCTI